MRTADTDVLAALAAGNLRPALLGEFYWDAGTEYLCSLGINLPWNGQTYIGAARVGRIDPIEEGSEIKMNGISMTLSGIPGAQMSIALGDHYQGRACILRLAVLTENYAIWGTPVVLFKGQIDSQRVRVGKTGSITITVENRLAQWNVPRVERCNDASQRLRNPNDDFCLSVAEMVEKQFTWGVASPNVPPSPSLDAASLANLWF